MYLSALRDHDQTIRKLGGLIDSGHDEFENFENAADDLERISGSITRQESLQISQKMR